MHSVRGTSNPPWSQYAGCSVPEKVCQWLALLLIAVARAMSGSTEVAVYSVLARCYREYGEATSVSSGYRHVARHVCCDVDFPGGLIGLKWLGTEAQAL